MRTLFVLLCIAPLALSAATDGIIKKQSENSVAHTMDKLESLVASKGFNVFVRINHAAGAASVGQALPPAELLIFGNPKVGSALMSSEITVGLDLPVKVLVWEDGQGRVWLAYNDPRYLAERHDIMNRPEVIERMSEVLLKFTDVAVGP
jgi:uncharacterized protein (DUF302 family)